jgi:hypothetical protein
MATKLEAALSIKHQIFLSPDPAAESGADGGPIPITSEQTDRWKQGTGSGQNDREYQRKRTVGAGATDSYNTLAAGSLVDRLNQAIDLDEFKSVSIKCTDGQIEVVGSAGNPLPMFTGAGEGFNLSAGQMCAFSLGSAGIDVTVNSLFEITETSTTAPATYVLTFTGAQ